MTPFADRIHASFDEVKRVARDKSPLDWAPGQSALRGLTWDQIARLPKDTFNTVQLDRVLYAVIRSYRLGPRSIWGPVLLEMLAPAVSRKVVATVAKSPAISDEDIEQQYLLEVLRGAAKIPIRAESRWIDRRVVLRAERCVLRWVHKVARASGDTIEEYAEDLEYIDRRDEFDELRDICGSHLPEADVALVYRFDVRREPIARLAGEAGVPVETMFTRLWRTRERLRRELEELSPAA